VVVEWLAVLVERLQVRKYRVGVEVAPSEIGVVEFVFGEVAARGAAKDCRSLTLSACVEE
jgi:hypothetical protein